MAKRFSNEHIARLKEIALEVSQIASDEGVDTHLWVVADSKGYCGATSLDNNKHYQVDFYKFDDSEGWHGIDGDIIEEFDR